MTGSIGHDVTSLVVNLQIGTLYKYIRKDHVKDIVYRHSMLVTRISSVVLGHDFTRRAKVLCAPCHRGCLFTLQQFFLACECIRRNRTLPVGKE